MREISIMIKPASSLCNMRCKYCFYAELAGMQKEHSFAVMQQDTMKEMLKRIREDLEPGDHITFAFQGGEPTLAGLEYFENFTKETAAWPKTIHVKYALQTNGTVLNEEWANFLAKHHVLTGVSLDLLPEQHDAVRVDEQGGGTWKRVRNAISLMEQFGVDYNVLCTLTRQVARHPQKVWKMIEKLNLKYIQLTPCIDELNRPGESAYALTPKRFASFYTELFQYWFQDYRNGKYRSIKLFDDLVNLLAFGVETACGMTGKCPPQLVVEADGSVYPCDFYCLDEYCLGTVTELGLAEAYRRSSVSPCKQRETLPELCSGCPYLKLCGGNCKRMQREICCIPGADFCGYREFLNTSIETLLRIAEEQRRHRQQEKR